MSKISIDQLHKEILTNRIIWAPDGDAAFDDGGHVLQFDDGIRVRLIAFRNPRPDEDIKSTLKDVVVEADVFYGVLGKWVSEFDNQRATILKAS